MAISQNDILAEVDLPIATFSDMENLRVGDIAIAIGSPLDEQYHNSVTLGVISAVRQMNLTTIPVEVLQTDAAINPGNSGGALVDEFGEIVGINTAKLSSEEVEGIGFALPINNVLPVAYELIEHGFVTRAGLGIMGSSVGNPVGRQCCSTSQLFVFTPLFIPPSSLFPPPSLLPPPVSLIRFMLTRTQS